MHYQQTRSSMGGSCSKNRASGLIGKHFGSGYEKRRWSVAYSG